MNSLGTFLHLEESDPQALCCTHCFHVRTHVPPRSEYKPFRWRNPPLRGLSSGGRGRLVGVIASLRLLCSCTIRATSSLELFGLFPAHDRYLAVTSNRRGGGCFLVDSTCVAEWNDEIYLSSYKWSNPSWHDAPLSHHDWSSLSLCLSLCCRQNRLLMSFPLPGARELRWCRLTLVLSATTCTGVSDNSVSFLRCR